MLALWACDLRLPVAAPLEPVERVWPTVKTIRLRELPEDAIELSMATVRAIPTVMRRIGDERTWLWIDSLRRAGGASQ